MAASVFDSPMFVKSFRTGDAARLFSDSASVRAVLLVQGTLAKVQGELGIVPEDSAFFIHRSAMEVQIDPAGLATDLAHGNMADAVRTAFQKAMEAPEHSKFIQQGVVSAEVEAAARSLRLRQFISHCEKNLSVDLDPSVAKALSVARSASVGLHLSTDANVSAALGKALRLPLLDHPANVLPVAQAAAAITKALHMASPEDTRLSQLNRLTEGGLDILQADVDTMANLCLPQVCLATACALEQMPSKQDR